MKDKIAILILAGGKGTRLKGKTIKPLYPLLDEPAIFYVLNSISHLNLDTYIVASKEVKEYFEKKNENYNIILQAENGYGTSWAIRSASNFLCNYDRCLILQADDPLINRRFINSIKSYLYSSSNVITCKKDIYKNSKCDKLEICKENLLKISKDGTYLNVGRYIFNCLDLLKYISLDVKEGKEYLLTNVINAMIKDNVEIKVFETKEEFVNMNSIFDVIRVEKILSKRINYKHLSNGVYMEYPSLNRIGPKVKIEEGVRLIGKNNIYGNSKINKYSKIKDSTIFNSKIEEDNYIENSSIYNSTIGCAGNILSSLVEDAIIKEVVEVGPFSHLRSGTILENNVCIGNFCETKQSHIFAKSKVKHLSYLGNAILKENVNVGCGVITANYDGEKKNTTLVDSNVFIGCNSTLIAPLHIEENSYIAGGSVINEDVPKDTLSFGRARQSNIIGRAKK